MKFTKLILAVALPFTMISQSLACENKVINDLAECWRVSVWHVLVCSIPAHSHTQYTVYLTCMQISNYYTLTHTTLSIKINPYITHSHIHTVTKTHARTLTPKNLHALKKNQNLSGPNTLKRNLGGTDPRKTKTTKR